MIKKILGVAVIAVLLFLVVGCTKSSDSGEFTYADGSKGTYNNEATTNNTSLTFEDFSKDFKKDASKEDIAKAKKIYDKILVAEKNDKSSEVEKLYTELYKLNIFKEDNIKFSEVSFKDFAKDFKKDISKEDLAKAKELYNKIAKLEKECKMKDAQELINELYELNIFNEIISDTGSTSSGD